MPVFGVRHYVSVLRMIVGIVIASNCAVRGITYLPSKGKKMTALKTIARRTGVVALVAVLAIASSTIAQVQVDVSGDRPATRNLGRSWKASELIGLNVYTDGDEEKGEINDLVISEDGKIAYAAVSFGGFLGIGDKLFAVPMDAIRLERKDGEVNLARIDVNEETIKQRQGFDQDHWPEKADAGFLTR